MLEYRLVLTKKAIDDMIDIGDYITYTLLEPQTSRDFVKGLHQAIRSLSSLPNRYSLINDALCQAKASAVCLIKTLWSS